MRCFLCKYFYVHFKLKNQLKQQQHIKNENARNGHLYTFKTLDKLKNSKTLEEIKINEIK